MLGLHFNPAGVLLSVCILHFTHSLHFTRFESAVRSLRFTLTDIATVYRWVQNVSSEKDLRNEI